GRAGGLSATEAAGSATGPRPTHVSPKGWEQIKVAPRGRSCYGAVVVARTSAVRDSLAGYGYLSQRLSASLLGRRQDPRHRRALRRARPQGWDPAVGRRLPTRQ